MLQRSMTNDHVVIWRTHWFVCMCVTHTTKCIIYFSLHINSFSFPPNLPLHCNTEQQQPRASKIWSRLWCWFSPAALSQHNQHHQPNREEQTWTNKHTHTRTPSTRKSQTRKLIPDSGPGSWRCKTDSLSNWAAGLLQISSEMYEIVVRNGAREHDFQMGMRMKVASWF